MIAFLKISGYSFEKSIPYSRGVAQSGSAFASGTDAGTQKHHNQIYKDPALHFPSFNLRIPFVSFGFRRLPGENPGEILGETKGNLNLAAAHCLIAPCIYFFTCKHIIFNPMSQNETKGV